MVESEEWLLRPVLAGLCKFESLLDGTLGLFDLYLMNEALDVQEENTARAHAAARKEN